MPKHYREVLIEQQNSCKEELQTVTTRIKKIEEILKQLKNKYEKHQLKSESNEMVQQPANVRGNVGNAIVNNFLFEIRRKENEKKLAKEAAAKHDQYVDSSGFLGLRQKQQQLQDNIKYINSQLQELDRWLGIAKTENIHNNRIGSIEYHLINDGCRLHMQFKLSHEPLEAINTVNITDPNSIIFLEALNLTEQQKSAIKQMAMQEGRSPETIQGFVYSVKVESINQADLTLNLAFYQLHPWPLTTVAPPPKEKPTHVPQSK